MVDALRPQRVMQRDAWRKTTRALRSKNSDARAQLIGVWAMYHEFDVDFYWLVESDLSAALDKYERDLRAWSDKLSPLAERESIAKLAQYDLGCLLDDIAANRLQDEYEGARAQGGEALGKWFATYADFQTQRAQRMQQRGKLVVELYRTGEVDGIRLTTALLERQVSERLLIDHLAEQAAHLGQAERKFTAERAALIAKQRNEWRQIAKILPEVQANSELAALADKVCEIEGVKLEILQLRAARNANHDQPPASDQHDPQEAELVKQLFAKYQDLQRTAIDRFFAQKINVEELARVHDLRMYTRLWEDKHLQLADVLADSIEVAAQWAKVEELLVRQQPNTIAAAIASAKKLEAEITREERKPSPAKPIEGADASEPAPQAVPTEEGNQPADAENPAASKPGQPTEATP